MLCRLSEVSRELSGFKGFFSFTSMKGLYQAILTVHAAPGARRGRCGPGRSAPAGRPDVRDARPLPAGRVRARLQRRQHVLSRRPVALLRRRHRARTPGRVRAQQGARACLGDAVCALAPYYVGSTALAHPDESEPSKVTCLMGCGEGCCTLNVSCDVLGRPGSCQVRDSQWG